MMQHVRLKERSSANEKARGVRNAKVGTLHHHHCEAVNISNYSGRGRAVARENRGLGQTATVQESWLGAKLIAM